MYHWSLLPSALSIYGHASTPLHPLSPHRLSVSRMSTHGAANATSMGPSPPGPAGGRPGKGDPAAAARRKVRDALNHQAAEEVWFAVVCARLPV